MGVTEQGFSGTLSSLSPHPPFFLSSSSPAKWSRLRCAHIPCPPPPLLSRPPWYLEVKGKTKGQWRRGSGKKAVGVIPCESAGPASHHFPLRLPPPQRLLSTGVLHTRGKRVLFSGLYCRDKGPSLSSPSQTYFFGYVRTASHPIPPPSPPPTHTQSHKEVGSFRTES